MMEQMDVNDIRALLSALIDGEVDDAKRHEAERLIAQCDEARSLMDEAEALDVLIARDAELLAGEPAKLPPGFEASVLAQTVEADRIAYGRRWTTWLGWVAAAACLTLAITIWVMDRQHWLNESMNGSTVTQDTPGDNAGINNSKDSNADGMKVHFTKRSWTIDTPLDQPNPHAPEIPVKQPVVAPPGFASMSDDQPASTVDDESPGASAMPNLLERLQSLPFRAHRLEQEHPFDVVALNEKDTRTLRSASALLEQLAAAETSSFRDVEIIRHNAERDGILDGLAAARANVQTAQRPTILAAESILLRIVRGPISQDDLKLMRADVQTLDLAAQLHGLTGEPPSARSF